MKNRIPAALLLAIVIQIPQAKAISSLHEFNQRRTETNSGLAQALLETERPDAELMDYLDEYHLALVNILLTQSNAQVFQEYNQLRQQVTASNSEHLLAFFLSYFVTNMSARSTNVEFTTMTRERRATEYATRAAAKNLDWAATWSHARDAAQPAVFSHLNHMNPRNGNKLIGMTSVTNELYVLAFLLQEGAEYRRNAYDAALAHMPDPLNCATVVQTMTRTIESQDALENNPFSHSFQLLFQKIIDQQTLLTLRSVQEVQRLGKNSPLKSFPKDLTRLLAEMLI